MRGVETTSVAIAILVVAAIAACGSQEAKPSHAEPEAEEPGAPPPIDTPPPVPPEPETAAPPPPDAAPPAPPPDAASPASPGPRSACKASASECCRKDGTIVKPGGCQPSYPAGVAPATERGPDGYCRKIPCYKKCLPVTARIATPGGDAAVAALRAGDLVWTVDEDGARVAAPIARVVRTPVLAAHEVVELTLSDGRVTRASAGHPTAGGVAFGDVRVGDRVDGAAVVATRRVAYEGGHTRDLLPAGATGHYWVDGVLVGSTLAPE